MCKVEISHFQLSFVNYQLCSREFYSISWRSCLAKFVRNMCGVQNSHIDTIVTVWQWYAEEMIIIIFVLLECFQYYTLYTYSNEVEATFLFFSLVLWMMVTIWTQFVPFDLSLSGAPPRLPVVTRLNMLVDNKFYLISPGQRPVSNQRSSWVEDVSTAAQSI